MLSAGTGPLSSSGRGDVRMRGAEIEERRGETREVFGSAAAAEEPENVGLSAPVVSSLNSP